VIELFGLKSHPAAVTKAPVDNFLITSLKAMFAFTVIHRHQ
tara:strand:+ start:2185 stop:2307 length:123 start_codon:yes stop_codon:yes gene_type:complete